MTSQKNRLYTIVILIPFLWFIANSVKSLDFLNILAVGDNELTVEVNSSYYVEQNESERNDISNHKYISFNKTINWGFDQRVIWYRYELRNLTTRNKNYILYMDNPMVDSIEVFELQGSKLKHLIDLGDMAENLSSEMSAMPHVKVEVKGQNNKTIVLRTQTTGAAFLPVLVFEESHFISYRNAIYLIWGAFIGVIVLMSLYNLTIYSGTGDKLYLAYIGYMTFYLPSLGAMHGFNIYVFSEDIHRFISNNLPAINIVVCYFSIAFAMRFLKLEKAEHWKPVKFAKYLSPILILLVPLLIFLKEYQAAVIFFPTLMITYVLAISLMLIEFRKRFKWTKFYIISWFPLLIGAGLGSAMYAGVIEYGFWTRYSPLIGVLIEMVLISTALAERLRISEAARLFQASHDPVFQLPNTNLLKSKLVSYQESNVDADFSVVAIQILKYESIVPYLKSEDLKEFVFTFLREIDLRFSKSLELVDIEPNGEFRKVTMIREGLFGFMISSNDPILMSNALERVANNQPMAIKVGQLSINVYFVVGTASLNSSKGNALEVLNSAQQAVDIAKSNDARLWTFSNNKRKADGRKIRIASDLQKAIYNNELELYHQPQINIITKACYRTECLVRWNHKEFGYIPPDEFVMIAEDTGIINELTYWVIKEALNHLSQLTKKQNSEFIVSINVSVIDIISEGFESFLITQLSEFNVQATQVIIEVTETTSVAERELLKKNLASLKELGFKVSIDDFGTGYSSLSYISRLPLDELKIDREFIMNILESEINKNIVSSTVSMANNLGFETVAEGVEDKKALVVLREYGCNYAQGFGIGKPMPLNELTTWLENHT